MQNEVFTPKLTTLPEFVTQQLQLTMYVFFAPHFYFYLATVFPRGGLVIVPR